MTLMFRLTEDMKQAMKNKDKFKLSVIRMVISSIKYAEIEKKSSLTDDQIIDVLTRELKQRRDSLHEFEKADRIDLIEQVKSEIVILQDYLPEQLSEDELKKVIQDTVYEIGAKSKSEIGTVMAAVMPKVKGRADGKLINKLVQDLLT